MTVLLLAACVWIPEVRYDQDLCVASGTCAAGDTSLDQDGDGYSSAEGDCDDAEPAVSPAADEVCGDGFDNDCAHGDAPCGGWGTLNFADADVQILGIVPDGELGSVLDFAGDANGDGAQDLLLGAPSVNLGTTYGQGAFYLVDAVSGDMDVSGAFCWGEGLRAEDELPEQVLGLGDVNQDDQDDILLSTDRWDTDATGAGGIFVFFGPVSGAVSVEDADATFVGEGWYHYAGRSVASVGHLDGSDAAAVLIGAPAWGESKGDDFDGPGKVYVASLDVNGTVALGTVGTSWTGVAETDFAGDRVSGAGDMDGDGLDEGLIAAPYGGSGGEEGAVYVISEVPQGTHTLADATREWVGQYPGDRLGSILGGAGDVDGDGYADAAVGTNSGDGEVADAGSVWLMGGGRLLPETLGEAVAWLPGPAADEQLGVPRWAPGRSFDITQDGKEELVILAATSDFAFNEGGAVAVFVAPVTGARLWSDADLTLYGASGGEHAGVAASTGVDVDADGIGDLVVGAPYAGVNLGAAYVVTANTILGL